MRKRSITTLICGFFAAAAALLAMGAQQPPQQPPPPPDTPSPFQGETPSLRQRLALSHEQYRQFRMINQERKDEVAAVRADGSLSRLARREKLRSINTAAETKIHAILNENQQAEYDQYQRERREKASRKRQTQLPPPPQ